MQQDIEGTRNICGKTFVHFDCLTYARSPIPVSGASCFDNVDRKNTGVYWRSPCGSLEHPKSRPKKQRVKALDTE